MFNKNEHRNILIEDLGNQGEGIGRINGFAFFVEGGLPGDLVEMRIVKLKKNYGFGKLIKIIEPSPARVTPRCPAATKCGGCTLQHMDYGAQLKFKAKRVRDSLERIGGFTDVRISDIIGMDDPYYYRNKAQFPVRNIGGETVVGFFSPRSHNIVGIDDCCIQHKANAQIIIILKKFMAEFNIKAYNETTHTGTVRHLMTRVSLHTGQIMVCAVINASFLPRGEILADRLRAVGGVASVVLNINTERTNVVLGKTVKTLWGQSFITDSIGGVKFNISPLSFFQVNPIQTKILYESVAGLARAGKNDTVIDAYCGIGTISLFLARKAKQVYGIEIVPEAVADAKKNAVLNGIKNVEFIEGAAEKILPEMYCENKASANIVVVDPPRKGCEPELLDAISKIRPRKIIYVSCDPSTLARDLKILCAAGFELKYVQPVDMFPMTTHVECCCLLYRK